VAFLYTQWNRGINWANDLYQLIRRVEQSNIGEYHGFYETFLEQTIGFVPGGGIALAQFAIRR
jgi:hypothetical protein